MANGLFNMPSPEAVRQQARSGLFKQAAQIAQAPAGRGFVQQAAQAGGLFGEAIGRAAGGQLPGEQQAQAFQEIQNRIGQEFVNKDLADPRVQLEMMGKTASEFNNAGMADKAMQVMEMANQIRGSLPVQAEDKFDIEFRKEERKGASQTIKGLETQASDLRSSFGKLTELSGRAGGKGTAARAARNSMIANIVRLNSPGIVSETELKTFSGAQGGTAALLDVLRGRGANVEAFSAHIDPSGEDFDVEGILGLGRDLILGQAQPIFDQFEDAKGRGVRAGLSERAQETIFGKSKNLDKLRALAASPVGAKEPTKKKKKKLSSTDQEALSWALANPNDPRAAQIRQKVGR